MKKMTQEDLVAKFHQAKFPETFWFKSEADHKLAPHNAFLKHAGFSSLDIYKAGIVSIMEVMNGRHKRNFSKNGVKTMYSKKKDSRGYKLRLFDTKCRVPLTIFYARRIDKHPKFPGQYTVTGYTGSNSKDETHLVLSRGEMHPLIKHLFLGE